jgi:hypothetical protein
VKTPHRHTRCPEFRQGSNDTVRGDFAAHVVNVLGVAAPPDQWEIPRRAQSLTRQPSERHPVEVMGRAWRAVPDDGLDVATGLMLGVRRGDPHTGPPLCRQFE